MNEQTEEFKKAIVDTDVAEVKKTLDSLPASALASLDQVFKDKQALLLVGLRCAISKCSQPGATLEQWKIALLVLQSSLQGSPIGTKFYAEKKDPLEPFHTLAYDQVPGNLANMPELSPLKALFSGLMSHREKLTDPLLPAVFYRLAQTLPALGWARSLFLPDNPKQACVALKAYMRKVCPEFSDNDFNQLPDQILTGFIRALKLGKEMDDQKYKQLLQGLGTHARLPTEPAKLVCEYYGFFHAEKKPPEETAAAMKNSWCAVL